MTTSSIFHHGALALLIAGLGRTISSRTDLIRIAGPFILTFSLVEAITESMELRSLTLINLILAASWILGATMITRALYALFDPATEHAQAWGLRKTHTWTRSHSALLFWTIAIGIMLGGIFAATSLLISLLGVPDSSLMTSILFGLCGFLTIWLLARILIIFPAIALSSTNTTLWECFHSTAPVQWFMLRLTLALGVLSLASLGVIYALRLPIFIHPGVAQSLLIQAILSLLTNGLSVAVSAAGVFTLGYVFRAIQNGESRD